MSSTDDAVSRWRAAALEQEGPAVEARGRAALSRTPDEAALRDLAIAGALVERAAPLDAEARARAVAIVRWGLASSSEAARWDALHAAAELALREVVDEVEALLGRPCSAPVRGRAAEALAALAPAPRARARLEPLRQSDPDWAVRRMAGEVLRQVEARRLPERGDPFARFRALVRGGRVRVEGGSAPLGAQRVAELGLRLPPPYRLFLATACAGGRLVLTELDAKGTRDVASLTLTAPAALRAELEAGGPRPDELRRIQEYVWTRYVEGAKGAAPLDEDWALRVLSARYDRGLVDADAWNYGVLLFEAAFRDEARRARHLLRAVAVLEAYRELEREPWDVVDDRLDEARAIVQDEGLRERSPAPDRADALLVLGRWEGVDPVAVDLERPGVFLLDADDPAGRVAGALAGTLLELLNDPTGHAPGARRAAPPPATPAAAGATAADVGPFAEVLEHLAAGRHRQAGRAFADTLEADPTAPVYEAASALLCRAELGPLLAAQLLACVLMAGDKKTVETAREVLQALPGQRVKDMLDAVAPYDEDGSQIAMLVDAAAGLRKKSHAEAKETAKRMKTSRSRAHVRTIRNPFYK